MQSYIAKVCQISWLHNHHAITLRQRLIPPHLGAHGDARATFCRMDLEKQRDNRKQVGHVTRKTENIHVVSCVPNRRISVKTNTLQRAWDFRRSRSLTVCSVDVYRQIGHLRVWTAWSKGWSSIFPYCTPLPAWTDLAYMKSVVFEPGAGRINRNIDYRTLDCLWVTERLTYVPSTVSRSDDWPCLRIVWQSLQWWVIHTVGHFMLRASYGKATALYIKGWFSWPPLILLERHLARYEGLSRNCPLRSEFCMVNELATPTILVTSLLSTWWYYMLQTIPEWWTPTCWIRAEDVAVIRICRIALKAQFRLRVTDISRLAWNSCKRLMWFCIILPLTNVQCQSLYMVSDSLWLAHWRA